MDHSLKQVTFGPGPDRAPMSDPSGKGIYFINGKTTGTLTLYRVSSRKFSDVVTEDATQPDFSNDGRHLSYISLPEQNKSELWIADLDGNNRLKLASGGPKLETLAWSNDATKYLFSENDLNESCLSSTLMARTYTNCPGSAILWALQPGNPATSPSFWAASIRTVARKKTGESP